MKIDLANTFEIGGKMDANGSVYFKNECSMLSWTYRRVRRKTLASTVSTAVCLRIVRPSNGLGRIRRKTLALAADPTLSCHDNFATTYLSKSS